MSSNAKLNRKVTEVSIENSRDLREESAYIDRCPGENFAIH